MKLTDKAWDTYISLLRRVNDKAASEMFSYLSHHEWWADNKARQAAVDFAFAIATKYGETAAAAAAQFYDEIANEWCDAVLPSAVPARTATYGEVAGAFNGSATTDNAKLMADAIGRLVKMAGVDTTLQNALRDGAEWAWIPRGDTCPYCLMLASRGWQNASDKAIRNGHAEHIHANCDCTYAVRFKPDQDVKGYEPDLYKRIYDNAEGRTRNQKVNSMARTQYALNKDAINARKRAEYAARKEREEE